VGQERIACYSSVMRRSGRRYGWRGDARTSSVAVVFGASIWQAPPETTTTTTRSSPAEIAICESSCDVRAQQATDVATCKLQCRGDQQVTELPRKRTVLWSEPPTTTTTTTPVTRPVPSDMWQRLVACQTSCFAGDWTPTDRATCLLQCASTTWTPPTTQIPPVHDRPQVQCTNTCLDHTSRCERTCHGSEATPGDVHTCVLQCRGATDRCLATCQR